MRCTRVRLEHTVRSTKKGRVISQDTYLTSTINACLGVSVLLPLQCCPDNAAAMLIPPGYSKRCCGKKLR